MPNEPKNTGSFVQTTQVWDLEDINQQTLPELVVRLHQQINNIANVLNTKTTALYLEEEFNNGSQWFNPNSTSPLERRPGFQKVIVFGAVGAGANTQAHNITISGTFTFTRISGAANNHTTPISYALPNSNIQLHVTSTDVVITNSSGVTFDNAYVVLEYVEF